jgi:putative addiction module component (TIGR02574 family)
MAPTLEELGLDRLSIDDRLTVAEAIWDSVSREVAAIPLTAPQRAELERRLADSIACPDAVTSWEVIKARALARQRPPRHLWDRDPGVPAGGR